MTSIGRRHDFRRAPTGQVVIGLRRRDLGIVDRRRRLWRRKTPLTYLSAKLGMRLVNLLVEVTYKKKGVHLEIPAGWR